ncbi:MAG: hemerythrin domain-containing protein [Planctomycetota bacterium]|nr:hemerythrin domain-containing protein [Planctomycetota bacterium]
MTTATATATLAVNAAFMQEIKDEHVRLQSTLVELNELIHEHADRQIHPRRLTPLLSQLCDALSLHFSLEESFGYFDDALDVAPHLSQQAEALRMEHTTLYETLCDLVEQSEQLTYHETEGSLQNLIEQCAQFYQELDRHESQENDLILRAFDEDLGVGD